jgi:hypothetical protein
MEDALVWVVVGAVVVGVLGAIAAAVARGSAYDHIGRGGLSLEDPAPPESGASAAGVRDSEIRQMLEARNRRRARRGPEPRVRGGAAPRTPRHLTPAARIG